MKKTYLCGAVLVASLFLGAIRAQAARALTFEERVKAQEAIERVYWAHRIWPKENPDPRPPFEKTLPAGLLRARVEDSLAESDALFKLWRHTITAHELQAEMNRMAARTRDGALLRELFARLGNDPNVIAETMARPALAGRMIRSWYAKDARFHGDLRRRAENEIARASEIGDPTQLSRRRTELEWRTEKNDDVIPKVGVLTLSEVDLSALREKLHQQPATMSGLCLQENDESFFVEWILSESADSMRTATVSWPKVPFSTWWSLHKSEFSRELQISEASFVLPALPDGECAEGTWNTIETGAPDPRQEHTAVWTGSEMIIWGGYASGERNSGARYDPATDTWVPLPPNAANTPSRRYGATAVWTGTELMVWGGGNHHGDDVSVGGLYDPTTDTWRSISTVNQPSPRTLHTMVWTGTKAIVWGGDVNGEGRTRTGGCYNPSTDTWVPTAVTASTPSERKDHTAVWTGSKMIIWGGDVGGGQYDPISGVWTAMGAQSVSSRVAVWTGTEMIVWGGGAHGAPGTGGRFNPQTNMWLPTSAGANDPQMRSHATAVWTGDEMIVWGGGDVAFPSEDARKTNTGGRYNPVTDSWMPTSLAPGTPTPREYHTAIWTGSEMIVWGGYGPGIYTNTGGRYDPITNTWTPTATGSAPVARSDHSAIWTGTEMIVWGGLANSELLTGGRYNAALDDWTTTVPAPIVTRYGHSAVWTGSEMIVWGGANNTGRLKTGAKYDPAKDTWTPTNDSTGAPSARWFHTAVWSGTDMIVWGGAVEPGTTFLNNGGRYRPAIDTWTPTGLGVNVPAARYLHTAVQVGGRMIVWGGYNSGGRLNNGGVYDPLRNTWTSTSTGAGVPATRDSHSAVGALGGMIVWGGDGGPPINTGGRYDLATDTWLPTSVSVGVPAGRYYHVAVWTGISMIVWSGRNVASGRSNDGGHYDPTVDTWTSTASDANLPEIREAATAIWTGSRMIVWGGDPLTATGGAYCASGCVPTTWYQDSDGDGYGDAGRPYTSCAMPAGSVSTGGDCDDAQSVIHPNSSEVCNGIDEDCDGTVDDSGPDICNDADLCTTDACTSGACTSTPVIVPEVNASLTVTRSAANAVISWIDGPGTFNVYRGTRFGPGWAYNASCLAVGTSGPETDSVFPGPGASAWYLVSRTTPCGESVLGRDSGGGSVPNSSPCP